MSFLNPLLLFGLLAIAIPVIIHLLNLSKVRKVEFSTLRFLKELQKTKMKRIRLRQLLLLLLRTLTIIFLVLSFADPILKGSSGNYAGRSVSLVVLDNSFSMDASGGKIFEDARTAAKEIVNELGDEGEVYLILTSEIGNESAEFTPENISALLAKTDSAAISLKYTSVTDILAAASVLYKNSNASLKELFYISDLQQSSFGDGKLSGANIFPDRFYLVDAGKGELNNMSLDSAGLLSSVVIAGMEAAYEFRLNNYSQFSQKSAGMRLYTEGKPESQIFKDIGSFESIRLREALMVAEGEGQGFEILLDRKSQEDDQLLQDNRCTFALNAGDKVKVAIVGSTAADAVFPELAMSSLINESGNANSVKGSFAVDKKERMDKSIDSYDVLILAGINSLGEDESIVLAEYLNNGGGLIMFPGMSLDVQQLNDRLISLSAGMRIMEMQNIPDGGNIRFGTVNFEHPVLEGVFRNRNLTVTGNAPVIEGPVVKNYYKVIVSESASQIINFANGDPFLTDMKFGNGRMIFSSVPLNPSASDLGTRSLFFPLLVRSVSYAASKLQSNDFYTIGARNMVKLSGIDFVKSVINPSGETVAENINLSGGNEHFLILPYNNKSSIQGIYEALDSAGKRFLFALNPDPRESDLSKASKDEAMDLVRSYGVENVVYSTWDKGAESYRQSRDGTALWKYFLALALLALLAEKLLARKIEKGES